MSQPSQAPAGIVVVILCLIVLGAGVFKMIGRTGGSAGDLEYRTDFAAAVEESRSSGKPMMINFGGDW